MSSSTTVEVGSAFDVAEAMERTAGLLDEWEALMLSRLYVDPTGCMPSGGITAYLTEILYSDEMRQVKRWLEWNKPIVASSFMQTRTAVHEAAREAEYAVLKNVNSRYMMDWCKQCDVLCGSASQAAQALVDDLLGWSKKLSQNAQPM